jgi:transposase-like protein
MRKVLNSHQKAKIALAGLKDDKTLAQLASEHQVHPSQISQWKAQLIAEAHKAFGTNGKTRDQQQIDELQRMVGQREAELEWLKKKLSTLPPRKT